MGVRRNGLPLSAMVLLLVLALASLGVAYAHWTKTLRVEGTVNTGSFDAAWTFGICSEFYPWPTGGNMGEVEGKDVGQWYLNFGPDPHLVHFRIENGYPSYAVDCELHYKNTGTIPWKVQSTSIVAVSPNLHNCTLTGSQTKTLACDELTVKWVDGIGSQVDPDDEMASSLLVHVEQLAQPASTYEFTVQVVVANWNEVP
jgi:hypothetical protein